MPNPVTETTRAHGHLPVGQWPMSARRCSTGCEITGCCAPACRLTSCMPPSAPSPRSSGVAAATGRRARGGNAPPGAWCGGPVCPWHPWVVGRGRGRTAAARQPALPRHAGPARVPHRTRTALPGGGALCRRVGRRRIRRFTRPSGLAGTGWSAARSRRRRGRPPDRAPRSILFGYPRCVRTITRHDCDQMGCCHSLILP